MRHPCPAIALIAALACLPGHAQNRGHAGHGAQPEPHAPAVDARPGTGLDVPPEARQQWDALRVAVGRYHDFEEARRQGWKKFGGDSPLMGEHWYHPGAPEPVPGEPLDFSQPSNLQYALVHGKRELVGVSYVVRIASGEPLPAGFAGHADHWHVHDAEEFVAAATEERPLLRWLANRWLDSTYRDKGDHRTRLAMVHAWVTLPSPDGPFSMHNRAIPYRRVGLPASYAGGGDEAAANGVNLGSAKGCDEALDGEMWIADARWGQSRTLKQACEALASQVRAAITLDHGAQAVNAAARRAWDELVALKRRTLTPRQLERIAAVTEHEPMH